MNKNRLEAFGDSFPLRPLLFYFLAIPLAFVRQAIAGGLYVLVALMWLIPDTRIEKVIAE